MGFGANGGNIYFDNFRLESLQDDDGDGTLDDWTTEYEDDFELTSSYTQSQPAHDPAGNLVYDGLHHFTYDAWNRLTMVRNAVSAADSDSSGVIEPDEVATGSIQAVYHYDGLNRRTLAEIDLARDSSGDIVTDGNNDPIPLSDLAAGYHYYYHGWSAIETRNGSDQVIKQQVWGTQYIDELCQIAVNDDPGVDDYPDYTPPQGEGSATQDTCETTYYALQGPTYNITGLIDFTGELVERYEYTPYGERQVYSSCGDNDPALMNPLPISQRVQVSSEDQPYGLCEFGHQGLMHDEATPGLVYNRNRITQSYIGSSLQRDPVRYPDGMNLYADYDVLLFTVDPYGLSVADDVPEVNDAASGIDNANDIGTAQSVANVPIGAIPVSGVNPDTGRSVTVAGPTVTIETPVEGYCQ